MIECQVIFIKIVFNYLNIDNLKKAILCEVKENWNLEISYDSYDDIDIVETSIIVPLRI